MFERVPSADAVMLKWILHDWGDEDCVKILKRCKEAIPKAGEKSLQEKAFFATVSNCRKKSP
ncbi:Tabersonine 16-O-methyltransferase [Acorus calamus]|uniref:Tabersonine 16-O-methyltransferase n=1 Tax=Acorus calamus TaxID=4465 RepID=A0AAV9FK93_ACOCL|nr:Tabersonine 16-O-methyltransferase [Acorus calamus]